MYLIVVRKFNPIVSVVLAEQDSAEPVQELRRLHRLRDPPPRRPPRAESLPEGPRRRSRGQGGTEEPLLLGCATEGRRCKLGVTGSQMNVRGHP